MTGAPNLVGHENQDEARYQFRTFLPLIQYKCSSQLQFFLCSVYVPLCTEKVIKPIGPCRPLCESVKLRCGPVLAQFDFPWPHGLECDKFPAENNDQTMCMEGPPPEDSYEHTFKLTDQKYKQDNGFKVSKIFQNSQGRGSHIQIDNRHDRLNYNSRNSSRRNNEMCSKLKFSKQYYYISRTEKCAHKCEADIIFNSESKYFASIWTSIWSVVCFLSTIFTFTTFYLDSSSFKYPERAIIFMSLNYSIYSVAYFVRLINGRKAVSCYFDSQHNVSLMIQQGLDNGLCTFIFLLLYFFGMSSALWWLILTITWFFATQLNWSLEKIEKKCSFYHLVAWGIPFIKTITILVLGTVDADELTGTCFVGNQNRSALLHFVILPNVVYLIIGILLLIVGHFLLYKSHRKKLYSSSDSSSQRVTQGSYHSSLTHTSHPHLLPQKYTSTNKIMDNQRVLLTRVGIFAFFYIIPSTCILMTNVYEYTFRTSWYRSDSTDRPNLEVFTLKIFMSFVVGIKAAIWIWSSKTSMLKQFSKKINQNRSINSHINLPSQSQLSVSDSNKRYPSRPAETSVNKVLIP